MKFTKYQQDKLIQLGIDYLLDQHFKKETTRYNRTMNLIKANEAKSRKRHNGHKWTEAQRAKFRETMRKKFSQRGKS